MVDACYGSAISTKYRNSRNGLEWAKTVHLSTPRWEQEGEWSTLSQPTQV
jgi:hypothetical protein